MTAQVMELLIYKGQEYRMASEPLFNYLRVKNISLLTTNHVTSCWRGYQGTWEIKKDTLYLISLVKYPDDNNRDLMADLFPGKTEVWAWWFHGTIRVPLGEMLEYVHSGYESVYEKDLILSFRMGHLRSETIEDNRESLK